jgi:hypothetical protein
MRYAPLLASMLVLGAAGYGQSAGGDRQALVEAKAEAEAATRRSAQLEQAARRATGDADRARAESGALAARIEAAEAELTVAERRIAIIAAMPASPPGRAR